MAKNNSRISSDSYYTSDLKLISVNVKIVYFIRPFFLLPEDLSFNTRD